MQLQVHNKFIWQHLMHVHGMCVQNVAVENCSAEQVKENNSNFEDLVITHFRFQLETKITCITLITNT